MQRATVPCVTCHVFFCERRLTPLAPPAKYYTQDDGALSVSLLATAHRMRVSETGDRGTEDK